MTKQHKQDTATRILDASLALIAEKGADALRTREILERAEISNLSAINYYFGSLDQLRLRILEHYFEGARPIITGIDDEDNPREALLGYCRRAARFVLDHPTLERNILFLALSGDPQTATPFSKIIAENISALTRLILRARKEHDPIKAKHDAITLASATIYPLLLISYGPGSVGIDFSDEGEREKYFTNLVDVLLGSSNLSSV
ncbi:MAG: TetR/AcrR family transcriptional regulator [Chloroflexota bacterium]